MVRTFFLGIALIIALTPVNALAQSRNAGGRTPTLLEIFERDRLQCGKTGWTFPVLIGGRTPLTACMLKVKQPKKSPFGPL